jgi:hypothetical protein
MKEINEDLAKSIIEYEKEQREERERSIKEYRDMVK